MRIAAPVALAFLAASATLAIAGCDDAPAVPSEGGWSASFQPGNSGNCNIESHNGQVGQVSAGSPDGVVVDGEDGAEVSCTVGGSGSFAVSGRVVQNGNALTITIPSISTANTQQNPATGTVAFSSPQTINVYTSSSSKPCNFFFTGGETVDTGKIWVSFECPSIINQNFECELSNGAVVLEDCLTSG